MKTEKINRKKETNETNKKNVRMLLIILALLAILFIKNASAQLASSGSLFQSSFSSSYVRTQNYRPSLNTYYTTSQMTEFWPKIFDVGQCYGRQDFIVQIPPAGCTPAVVRSDLLEEQPVPVFCQINAIKVNPLIGVSGIRNINFRGYPSEVLDVGFYPARAALSTWDRKLSGSPIIENIGYGVFLIKPYSSEKEMPEFIEANITALIIYDATKIMGVGKSEFYLPVLTEEEWENGYKENSFWKGQGYLRADWVEDNRASISVYTDSINRINSIDLEKGKTSGDIYLPSYYCQVALKIKLNDIGVPEKSVKLLVSGENIEDEYWLKEKDKFLDCTVERIEVYKFGGGSVDIKCPKERFTLSTSITNKFSLEVDGKQDAYDLGSQIKDIYPVFTGYLPEKIKIEGQGSRMFIILIQSTLGEEQTKNKIAGKEIENILNGILKDEKITKKEEFIGNVTDKINRLDWADKTGVIFLGENKAYEGIKFLDSSASFEKKYIGEEEDIETYFDKTKEAAYEIVKNFPDETNEQKKAYGEEALYEAAVLAGELGKTKSRVDILSELLEKYPKTTKREIIENEIFNIKQTDSSNSYKTTEIKNGLVEIQLVEIKEPSEKQLSVVLDINGKEKTALLDERIYENEKGDEYLEIDKITEESVIFTGAYRKDQHASPEQIKEKAVSLNKRESVGGQDILIKKINIQKVASVSLEPKAIATQSEANFTFRIGIEKRAIKLSPEKTQEMLVDLNKTIGKWEKISKGLSETVKVMKSACFATTALLTVKNLIYNMGGKALARQEAMRGKGGWYEVCAELAKKYPDEYSNMNDCLRKKATEIEKSVTDIHKAIKDVESEAKQIYQLGSEEQIAIKYIDTLLWPAAEANKERTIKVGENPISIGTILDSKDTLTKLNKDGYLGERDMRDISTWLKVLENSEQGSVAYQRAEAELSIKLESVEKLKAEMSAEENAQKAFSFLGGVSTTLIAAQGTKTMYVQTKKLTASNLGSLGQGSLGEEQKLKEGAEVTTFIIPLSVPEIGGKNILAKLDNNLQIEKAFSVEDNVITKDVTEQVKDYVYNKARISKLAKITPELCKNKYVDYKIKFYTTSPYKGMPAVVPVDIETGWYAATKQILPVLGSIVEGGTAPYTEAGEVKSFWLVNVGPNGREEFDSLAGDDYPRTMINFDTRQPLDQIGCLDSEKARRLVEQAVTNIREAASQYRAGVGKIELRMLNGDSVRIPVESAEGNPSNAQCQDFMSPNDCYLMFNLCDPVLCPSSRCNLGGTYYVDNVVQSGIVGSIALCLPNIKEGIFVPVCLTGIQAGLDAYISILKAKQQCLEVSLKTGQMIGICDEIYSVYACEFFWRQLAPVVKYGLPKLIEFISGKGTRGGGEYANVQSAWKNMENTMDYFTNEYAVNAMEAFKMRSTDQAGTEICKVFVSQRYPSGKGFFDALVEPDSPPQFYARFDEIPYTDATVPATSQYKIFYHIYAGKDRSSYYSIYLRNPPESSLYASNPVLLIKSSFVANGSSASETIDTTAPSGYQELCVRIDLKEECGFKQVSSDFALNYIEDKYIEEQATQEIATESECISGTISPLTLLQPNIEEGVQETIEPEIYKRGLTRVCSSENPGSNIDSSRWKEVGYCGDKRVKCWLDTSSVKDVIKEDRGLLNQTLTEVNKIDIKNRFGEAWDKEETINKLNEFKKLTRDFLKQIESDNIDGLKKNLALTKSQDTLSEISNSLEEMQGRGYTQSYKAAALFEMFSFYKVITERLKELTSKKATANLPPTPLVETPPAVKTPATPPEETEYTLQGENIRKIMHEGEDIGLYIKDTAIMFNVSSVGLVGADDVNIGGLDGNVLEFRAGSYAKPIEDATAKYFELNGATIKGNSIILKEPTTI